MEENLVLPVLPGGSQSKGSSSLALPGSQTVPLDITHNTAADLESNLALTLFLLRGDEDFLENQSQGSLGEVEQTLGFFPLLKKDQEAKLFPLPVLGYHTMAMPRFVTGYSLVAGARNGLSRGRYKNMT